MKTSFHPFGLVPGEDGGDEVEHFEAFGVGAGGGEEGEEDVGY